MVISRVHNYVHRKCAELKDIKSNLLQGGENPFQQRNLSFLGPKSSGKTTTLLAAYFFCNEGTDMDCGFIDLSQKCKLEEHKYYFVDNAQLLDANPDAQLLLFES